MQMMVKEVSLQDAAIIFVACTMSRALGKEFASLLFSTQVRCLSDSFFLYLLFADRMIPWSSGCIIEVALGSSMRNLMWEYSQTCGLKHCHKHTVCDNLRVSFHC